MPAQKPAARSGSPAACWLCGLAVLLGGRLAAQEKRDPSPPSAALSAPVSDSAQARIAALGEIDAALAALSYEGALAAAAARVQEDLASLRARDLAESLARQALAEAGLGRTDEAIWHWEVAQNLDRWLFPESALRSLGPPGILLAAHRLRAAGTPPAGLKVWRGVRAKKKLKEVVPKMSTRVAGLPVPKGLKVELVLDEEGRPRNPVVVDGGAPGFVYEVLESVRDWRYEPARRGKAVVSVYQEATFNRAGGISLTTIAELGPEAQRVDSLLRQKAWRKARDKADELWRGLLDGGAELRRNEAGIALTLRALVAAGLGQEDEAICRWQAAQHLEPRLYQVELWAYGAPGKLLVDNRWGSVVASERVSGGEFQAPTLAHREPIQYPLLHRRGSLSGTISLLATITAEGKVRQPLLVDLRSAPETARGLAAEESAGPEVLPDLFKDGDPRRLGLAALEGLCRFGFRPARVGGKAIVAQTEITLSFDLGVSQGGRGSQRNISRRAGVMSRGFRSTRLPAGHRAPRARADLARHDGQE